MAYQFKNFRLKLADAGSLAPGEFRGHASMFGNVDLGGDRVKRGAFARTLKAQNGRTVLLWQHDTEQPIGVADLEEDTEGLAVHGQLNMEVQKGREASALLKQGAFKGMSFGYDVVRSSPGTNGAYRNLEELKLYEVSLVTFPMNPEAGVERVKALMLGGQKYVDFATTDGSAALYQARYRMQESLSSAMFSIMRETDREMPERMALCDESLEQYHKAMLAWCALYMEAEYKAGSGPAEAKGLRSPESVATVQGVIQALQALLVSPDSGKAHSIEPTEPAPATAAPHVDDTSALEKLVAEIRRDAAARLAR